MSPPRDPPPPAFGRHPAEPRWRRYLRFWKPDVDADLEDEIRFHVEMRARDYVARGLSPAEAAHAAERRFGDLGIYGVLAYAVTQRTREIGIRVALGARGSDVVALVVRRMAMLILLGLAIGTAIAYAGGQSISAFLVGIDGGDPIAFGAAILLLAAVAVVASWLPARRAARVDPVTALRAE